MILPVMGLYSVDDRMINKCGAVGEMKTGRENQSSHRKFVPVPFCPPQIPHDQTWD
jgi:hypothetical protein